MKNRVFTIPNILTFIRFALIPVLVLFYLEFYQTLPFLPAVVFFIISLTDAADGFIARRYDMETDLGKVLDPLADKLFVLSMLICFTIKQPSVIIGVLLAITLVKELYMIVAATLLYSRKFVIRSHPIGKFAALTLNLGVFLYFFISYHPSVKSAAQAVLLLGLILSISAAIYYTVIVYKQTGGRLPPKK